LTEEELKNLKSVIERDIGNLLSKNFTSMSTLGSSNQQEFALFVTKREILCLLYKIALANNHEFNIDGKKLFGFNIY